MEGTPDSLTWKTLEYDFEERTTDWFWAVGIIAVAICITSFVFKNYLFGILILIAIATLMYLSVRPPEEITIGIDHRGIRVRDDYYLYQNIKSFWVEADHMHERQRHLLVMTNRFFLPMIALPIPPNKADVIRNYLLEYTTEKEMQENRSYQFFERLGL